MLVVGEPILTDFARRHKAAEARLRAWLAEADAADWRSPHDIKARYTTASILADNRVVFNIGGNSYRLLVHVNYAMGVVAIERVGTHAEYDRWQRG